jgi:hypothetical protein
VQKKTDQRARATLTSISQAALICGSTRETIRKRIAKTGIKPAAGDDQGHPLYEILDVVAAYLGVRSKGQSDPVDPSDLPPAERNAWFQSESKRLDLLERMGQLLPAKDWEREASAIYTELAQFFESLPDVMERDADLTPQQIQRLSELLDRERLRLHQDITTKRMPREFVPKTGRPAT